MSIPISEYIDLQEAERRSGIRIDALRRNARAGKLRTTRVGGTFGPHLVLPADLEAFLKLHASNRKPRSQQEVAYE
mgnify:CR=1 FL=1